MGVFKRILGRNEVSTSRFHTQDGELIDLAGLRYLPNSIVSTFGRLVFGVRPKAPWLGYRAIRHLDKLLDPSWEIIEFGSGMSTVWFSQRVKHVYSIESNPQWHAKVKADLERRGIKNVTYKLCEGLDYAEAAHVPDNSIDFILVDGVLRHPCMHTSLKKIKPDGWIYLDNTDKQARDPQGDITLAEKALEDYVARHGKSRRDFIDFLPTYILVMKGMLAQIGK